VLCRRTIPNMHIMGPVNNRHRRWHEEAGCTVHPLGIQGRDSAQFKVLSDLKNVPRLMKSQPWHVQMCIVCTKNCR
jgi:hypothetical protein